jgi:hypothetical protein
VSQSLLESILRGTRATGTSLEVVAKDVALAVAFASAIGEDASVLARRARSSAATEQGLDGYGLPALIDVEPRDAAT